MSVKHGRTSWMIGWVCESGCDYDLCFECMQTSIYMAPKFEAEKKITD
jgi:hypothetical protein